MDKNLIVKLREKTGAGLALCKKALDAAQGDLEEAVVWMRKQGAHIAMKKSDREAKEGVVGLLWNDNGSGVMVEVNCESDFVARNEKFHTFVRSILTLGLTHKINNLQDLLGATDTTQRCVQDLTNDAISLLQENIVLRRWTYVEGPQVFGYVHNMLGENIGSLGVLGVASVNTPSSVAKDVAMHIAALDPAALSREDIAPNLLQREKDILLEQMKTVDKPDAVKEKMLEGRLNKFYAESVLLEQGFVKDPKKTVKDVLQGHQAELSLFKRFAVGGTAGE